VVVTFNGEIFNFMEVETELLARGTPSAPAATPR